VIVPACQIELGGITHEKAALMLAHYRLGITYQQAREAFK
jgi:hypothetical protein